ncbi:MAG: WYL domain-containing protein [Erysipelotrichaceae bacterium]|nr:WYL domain-containing protein [Erysipelotrichaceae bacterium]
MNMNDRLYAIGMQLESKLNIYFDEETYAKLIKDMNDFDVVKRNGEVNKSEFMNRLIANYSEDFIFRVEALSKTVRNELYEYGLNDIDTLSIKTVMSLLSKQDTRSNKSRTYSFRVNRKQIPAFTEILLSIPYDQDISSFLRNMVLSYLSLPIYKREQIIFKKEYEKLMDAIERKLEISFTYRKYDRSKKHIVSPYSIERSENEMRNYLIVESHNWNKAFIMSLKLYDISDITILKNEKAHFSDNFNQYFTLMKKNGIAYNINEYSIKKVRMDEKALNTYKHKYLERPPMLEYKDGIASFDCSESQLEFYFEPFKDHAEII